jgi:hypothetical protein
MRFRGHDGEELPSEAAGRRRIDATRRIDRDLAASIFALTLLFGGYLYLVQVQLFGAHFWSLPSGLMLRDFGFFWGGARLFWLGNVGAVFDPGQFNAWLAQQIAPGSMEPFATWSYPPTMLLPLLPFGLLPAPIAMVLWMLGTFALLGLVLGRLFQDRWLVLAVVLSPAAWFCFSFAQNGAFTAALLIAGLWMTDRRPVTAGICFGLLIIKPQLGILLPFALVAGGHWRVFVTAAVVASGVVALTALLFGIDAWAGFLHRTMPAMTTQLLHDYGIPPQRAMPTMLVTLQGWGTGTSLAGFGQGLSALCAIAAVIWAWRRPRADANWRNALTCAAVLLATPFGYVYDMIPAMLAVALVTRAGPCGGFSWLERPTLAIVWAWPAVSVLWTYRFGLRPIGGFALVALVCCLIGRIARKPDTVTAAVPGAYAPG